MHTAICTFDDRATAEQAVQRLVQAGFDRDDRQVPHDQVAHERLRRLAFAEAIDRQPCRHLAREPGGESQLGNQEAVFATLDLHRAHRAGDVAGEIPHRLLALVALNEHHVVHHRLGDGADAEAAAEQRPCAAGGVMRIRS